VVRHQNHLAVMSALAQALNGSSATPIDFTTGSDKYCTTGGSAAKELETGAWGTSCGDADKNGSMNATNYLIFKPNVGITAQRCLN
jgi:hypothetical protein